MYNLYDNQNMQRLILTLYLLSIILEIIYLILNNIFEQQREIQAKKRILESYNPQNILSKGYALVSGKLAAGEEIMIQTIDKKITAEVKNVERN